MTTYYVSRLAGLDTNPGNQLQPWASIKDTLAFGDIIYVDASGPYNQLITPQSGGIQYIAMQGPMPVINATGISTKRGSSVGLGIIFLGNFGNILFDGFEVKNSLDGPGIYNYNSAVVSGLTFRNMKIHDIAVRGGICLGMKFAEGGPRTTNVIIDGVETYNTNHDGDQEAISLIGIDGFQVTNSKWHDTYYPTGQWTLGKEGLDCKVGCRNGVIKYNEGWNCKIGLYIDANNATADNILVGANRFHHNRDSGIALGSEGSHQAMTRIRLENNLVYLNAIRGMEVFAYAFQKTFTLINSTFYHNGEVEFAMFDSPQYQVGCIMRNNIFEAMSGRSTTTGDLTNIIRDHNLPEI